MYQLSQDTFAVYTGDDPCCICDESTRTHSTRVVYKGTSLDAAYRANKATVRKIRKEGEQ